MDQEEVEKSNTESPKGVIEEKPLDESPSEPPKKKKRQEDGFENLYLDQLPNAMMYEVSYMHRDVITHTEVAHGPAFLITCSRDGHVKFWKKQPEGIEFVKHFKAHSEPIRGVSVSADGLYLATVSGDKTIKVFDIPNFDMINMISLEYSPSLVEWVYPAGGPKPQFVVTDKDTPTIRMYHAHGTKALKEYSVHTAAPTILKYNQATHICVSTDSTGVLEYWNPSDGSFPADHISFKYKAETDLYAFAKAKALPTSLAFSRDGHLFATHASDSLIRVFRFASGKLYRTYDESIKQCNELQKSGIEMYHLDHVDFGRRMAVEKKLADDEEAPPSNVVFDESGRFIIFPTLLGIKIVNLATNQLARLIGQVESTERFLAVCLYQGRVEGIVPGQGTVAQAAPDPTIICAAYRRQRFYVFTKREPEEPEGEDALLLGRDKFNEKPTKEEQAAAVTHSKSGKLGKGAIIHTSMGDITVTLYPELCPKAVENFVVHSRNGYYNGLIFHRVIKSFMIQTGDPNGDGTGGTSIWNEDFEDEFHRSLRHDRPFCLSMANAGPNTNGSQFFVTTVPTPWLDNKHTLFGRVVQGTDVVQAIERAKVNNADKPFEDVSIVSVTVKD